MVRTDERTVGMLGRSQLSRPGWAWINLTGKVSETIHAPNVDASRVLVQMSEMAMSLYGRGVVVAW
jgi:hypothetical protein